MATKLGELNIFIPKGAIVCGIALLDADRKPLGGTGINPIRPGDGDFVQVVFDHIPENEKPAGKVRASRDTAAIAAANDRMKGGQS